MRMGLLRTLRLRRSCGLSRVSARERVWSVSCPGDRVAVLGPEGLDGEPMRDGLLLLLLCAPPRGAPVRGAGPRRGAPCASPSVPRAGAAVVLFVVNVNLSVKEKYRVELLTTMGAAHATKGL